MQKIPRNVRLMYGHAFQSYKPHSHTPCNPPPSTKVHLTYPPLSQILASYIWNEMASLRIQRGVIYTHPPPPFPPHPSPTSTPFSFCLLATPHTSHLHSPHLDPLQGLRPLPGDLILVPPPPDAPPDARPTARALTAEEAEEGSWGVEDVVLPLPGHDVVYPEGMEGAYLSLMAKHNITQESFKGNKVRDLQLPGGYRKLLTKVVFFLLQFDTSSDPIT